VEGLVEDIKRTARTRSLITWDSRSSDEVSQVMASNQFMLFSLPRKCTSCVFCCCCCLGLFRKARVCIHYIASSCFQHDSIVGRSNHFTASCVSLSSLANMCRHYLCGAVFPCVDRSKRALMPDESKNTPASSMSANQVSNYPVYAKPMHVSPFTFKNTAFQRLPQQQGKSCV